MEHGKTFSTTDGPLVDFDAVCQKVRAAVEPARAHAVSLHDELGDVLWLSESSMGPDEHNAVREAVEAFSNPNGPPMLVHDLGDSRSALLLRAVNARRAMVGVIMMIMDARVIRPDARGALKVMTPKLQRALVDFATMRPESEPPPARTPPARTPPAGDLSLVEEVRTPPPAPPPRAVPPPAPPRIAAPPAPPRAVSPPAPPRAAMNGKASAAAPVARAAPAAVPAAPPAAAPRALSPASASRPQDGV